MVLAAVQKWDSDEKKMDHLPLFLDGDAFLVYTRMLDTDKKKPAEVKKRMEQAFFWHRGTSLQIVYESHAAD